MKYVSLLAMGLLYVACTRAEESRVKADDLQWTANVFPDPGFDQGDTNGADFYEGGTAKVAADKILEAHFAGASSELFFELRLEGALRKARKLEVAADLRNGGNQALQLEFCAAAFDADWAHRRHCQNLTLAAGATQSLTAAMDFADPKELERTIIIVVNKSGGPIDLLVDNVSMKLLAPPAGQVVQPNEPTPENPLLEKLPVPEPIADHAEHPRLLVAQSDLDRLRSWATMENPVYAALLERAQASKADVESGEWPAGDSGIGAWTNTPSESYAELFAFMSLLATDAAAKEEWALLARRCLMHVIDQAKLGVAEDLPFRSADFAISDRARWTGEGFALTVDWIYPFLSSEDKAAIHKVFTRWTRELVQDGYHRPEPLYLMNDPQLLANRSNLRWANNNYFNMSMRNVGLMALSLDSADDVGGELRPQLRRATGSWLYMVDHLLRTDSAGGFLAEGFEYSPQSMAYEAQFLWMLQSSGYNKPADFGPQVAFNNPFWNDVLPALFLSLTPRTISDWRGEIYQASWYGAGQYLFVPELIAALGPLALRAMASGDQDTVNAIRWFLTHVGPGGVEEFSERIAEANSPFESILYFLIFDPKADAAKDPRPAMKLSHFAPGIGRMLVRSDWSNDASLFSFSLSWLGVDHQTGDALNFDLYRKGEWLTKRRVGYSEVDYAMSDNHNTLAVENSEPGHSEDPRRFEIWKRGSQDALGPIGDPRLIAESRNAQYAYIWGDATNLYNSDHEGTYDVGLVSRSLVYLQPDTIVTYDRVESKVPGRFKRFHLQLPADAAVQGKVVTMKSAGGQNLFVQSLLPEAGTLKVTALQAESSGTPAGFETISHRLTVEAPIAQQATRFLHVIEGKDGGHSAAKAQVLRSQDGLMEGLIVADTLILFPVNEGALSKVQYRVPTGVSKQMITGLEANAGYNLQVSGSDYVLTKGGDKKADAGGVLWMP